MSFKQRDLNMEYVEHAGELGAGDHLAYPWDSTEFHDHFVVTYMVVTKDVYQAIVRYNVPVKDWVHLTFNKVLYVVDVNIEQEFATAIYQHDDKYFVVRID